jgi:hypothetical protein
VRTTLSLDDDVAKLLRQQMRRSGGSFKQTVNHFLRLGLTASSQPARRKPFVVDARPMGLPPGLSYDNIEELLEALEGPYHR